MNTLGNDFLKGMIDFTQNTFYNKKEEKVKINNFKLEKLSITFGKQAFDLILFIIHSDAVVLIYGINSLTQTRSLVFSKKYEFAINLLGSYCKDISTIVLISNHNSLSKNITTEDNYYSHSRHNDTENASFPDISNKFHLVKKDHEIVENSFYLYSQVKGKFMLNLIFEKPIISYLCNIDFLIIQFADEIKIYCNETKKLIFQLSIQTTSLYDLSNTYLAVYNSVYFGQDFNSNKSKTNQTNNSSNTSYLENCVTWGKQLNDIYNLSLELGGKNINKNSKLSKFCYVTIFYLDDIKKVLIDSNSYNCFCTNTDKGGNVSGVDLHSILKNYSSKLLIPFFKEITELSFINKNRNLLVGVNGQVFYLFDLFPTSHLKYNDNDISGKNYSSFRDLQFEGFKLSPRKTITNNTDYKLSFTVFRGYTTSTIYNTDCCSNFLIISTGNGTVHLYYLPVSLNEDYIENVGSNFDNEEAKINPKEAIFLDKISYSSILNKNSKIILYSSITIKPINDKSIKDNSEDLEYHPVITIIIISGESLFIEYYYYDFSKKGLIKISSDSIDNSDFKDDNKFNLYLRLNLTNSEDKESNNNALNKKNIENNVLNNYNYTNSPAIYLNPRQLKLVSTYKYNKAVELKTFNKCISDIHHNPVFKVSLHKRSVYSATQNSNNNSTNINVSQVFYSQRRKSIESARVEVKNDNLIRVSNVQLYITNNIITVINTSDNNLYEQILYSSKCLNFLSFSQTNDKSEYNMVGKSNLLSQSCNYNSTDYMETSHKCPKVVINFNQEQEKFCGVEKSSFYENKEMILKNNIKQAMESSFKKNEKDVVVFSSELNFNENYMS